MTETIPIDAIRVGPRHRKKLGDLAALSASLERVGLLHPPVLSAEGELICGFRRLEAARRLGWTEIDVRIVETDPLVAERDENEVREDFTASEKVAIAKAIEARIGERRGRPSVQDEGSTGNGEVIVGNCPQIPASEKTRDVSAKAAGFESTDDYRRAAKVVKKGTSALVEMMDEGEVSLSAAAAVADLPEEVQAAVVAEGPKAVKTKARQVREARGGTPKKESEPTERGAWLAGEIDRIRDDLLLLVRSVKEEGGIDAWTRDWSPRRFDAFAHSLGAVVENLQRWVDYCHTKEST
jgi:ParB family chromosome partitioning protein